MRTKEVYQLDKSGIFIGVETSYESPLEPNVFLIPAGCVEKAPPEFDNSTQFVQWNGKSWEIKDIPLPEPLPEPVKIPEPTPEQLEAQRIEDEIQAELRQMAIERIEARKQSEVN